MFKTTYIAASFKTKLKYLYNIDPVCYPEMELRSITGFMAAFADLKPGEEIFTVFGTGDEDMYNEIHKEYHISKIFSKVS